MPRTTAHEPSINTTDGLVGGRCVCVDNFTDTRQLYDTRFFCIFAGTNAVAFVRSPK